MIVSGAQNTYTGIYSYTCIHPQEGIFLISLYEKAIMIFMIQIYSHNSFVSIFQILALNYTWKGKVLVTSDPHWTVARQAPLSIGFSRQEYWNGLPFPSPGDHPDPGIKPGPPALQILYLLSYYGSHIITLKYLHINDHWQISNVFWKKLSLFQNYQT